MNNEYEQYYCKTCNKLFNDLVHTPYYTLNKFVDNQNCLIDSVRYRHGIVQPKYRANCPHCDSIHTVIVNDILDGKIICRSEKIYESKDRAMLKYLGEMLKLYCEITGYRIQHISTGFALYTDDHLVRRKINSLLSVIKTLK